MAFKECFPGPAVISGIHQRNELIESGSRQKSDEDTGKKDDDADQVAARERKIMYALRV